jgi:hypothetical protein
MALNLTSLVSQLQDDVPQRGNVPSEVQYADCVQAAVADYGRRRPMLRRTSIDVVSGTAEYSLPADFYKLVTFQSALTTGGVMIKPTGLVPVPDYFQEDIEVLGRTLRIVPTPAYSWEGRVLKYLAVHVLDDDQQYPYLEEEDAAVFMLKAQAIALRLIANTMSSRVADFSVRDVRENRSSPLSEMREQIESLEQDYQQALDKQNTVMPVLGHGYSQSELEALL